jgi:putative endonuclease
MERTILGRIEEYLTRRGYSIADREWHGSEGAVDLLAVERGEFVVVIVKVGTRGRSHAPLEKVSQAAQKRLRGLAVEWLRAHGQSYDRIRLDAVEYLAEGPGSYTISHVRGAGS